MNIEFAAMAICGVSGVATLGCAAMAYLPGRMIPADAERFRRIAEEIMPGAEEEPVPDEWSELLEQVDRARVDKPAGMGGRAPAG